MKLANIPINHCWLQTCSARSHRSKTPWTLAVYWQCS